MNWIISFLWTDPSWGVWRMTDGHPPRCRILNIPGILQDSQPMLSISGCFLPDSLGFINECCHSLGDSWWILDGFLMDSWWSLGVYQRRLSILKDSRWILRDSQRLPSIHGQFSLGFFGILWDSLGFFGILWNSWWILEVYQRGVSILGDSWGFLKILEDSWRFLKMLKDSLTDSWGFFSESSGFLRIPEDSWEFLKHSVTDSCGFPEIPEDSWEFPAILDDSQEFLWILDESQPRMLNPHPQLHPPTLPPGDPNPRQLRH